MRERNGAIHRFGDATTPCVCLTPFCERESYLGSGMSIDHNLLNCIIVEALSADKKSVIYKIPPLFLLPDHSVFRVSHNSTHTSGRMQKLGFTKSFSQLVNDICDVMVYSCAKPRFRTSCWFFFVCDVRNISIARAEKSSAELFSFC